MKGDPGCLSETRLVEKPLGWVAVVPRSSPQPTNCSGSSSNHGRAALLQTNLAAPGVVCWDELFDEEELGGGDKRIVKGKRTADDNRC